MPCLYCGSNKIVYTCGKCHSEFCELHNETTETYSCKKHGLTYSPGKAAELDYKCTHISKSSCPQCSSELMLDKIPNGHYFLRCTKCSWNSFSGTPSIHYITQRLVLQEGESKRLLRRTELCDIRLKKNRGIDVCPNCLSQFLINGGITSFSTIKNMFNLDAESVLRIINKLISEKRVSGHIDTKNQVFVYIPEEAKNYVLSELKENGKIALEAIANRFNIPKENAVDLMYEILRMNQIHGAFSQKDQEKEHYYTADFLNNYITERVNSVGRIQNQELGKNFNLSSEIIKDYIMKLIKDQKLSGYYADNGNEIVTKEKLQAEVLAYAEQHGLFKLAEAAESFKVAVELIRRSLFSLVQDKKLRGTFTQKREFITEQQLSENIKGITKAYRVIKLRELARKLGTSELRVEEILASLIARGAIYGYIDMNNHEFVADVNQPQTMGPAIIPTDNGSVTQSTGEVKVIREYDFVGGQLHFKVVVQNLTNMAIHDIKVVLDVPTSYRRKTDFINIPVIDPQNTRGVDFYLEPSECGISTIGGTVIYKNAMGEPRTVYIKPKEVQIKCPLVVKTLDTIEDCQVAIQSLPSDARAFLIADLDPQLAYRAAFRAITNFDTRNVTSLEVPDQDNYQAEAWFSSEAKVTGGRIITRISVNGSSQSLEIRVWCSEPGQLTGFLAKIIEVLFLEINIVRQVKAEARQRTLDVMSITQNLITASDFCAVRYKAKDILLKLEDTHARMKRVIGDADPILSKIDYWIEKLGKYDDEQVISDDEADALVADIEGFQNKLARSLAPT